MCAACAPTPLTTHPWQAEPLHRLMERYQEAMGLSGRQLRFFFDGQRLAGTRTPEQLGMEPDDVIEAWA
uniref:NFATC2-interacting protein n=1 Tax=Chelonoidis abingdonii TaxID=106734 RepID=A0A8C0HGN9_CHEAB